MPFSLSPIKTEAYIQHFRKLHGAEAATSQQCRLGLRPVPEVIALWKQRPAQQAAGLCSNLNLF